MKWMRYLIFVNALLLGDDNLTTQLEEYNTLFYEEGSKEAIEAVENDLSARKAKHMSKWIPKVGDKAIDFTLMDLNGNTFHLKQELEKSPVVLFWYRGGWCPYCNIQLAYYQQHAQQIQEAGGTLVGIAPEVKAMGEITRKDHEVSFTLLSDNENTIAKKYHIVYTVEHKLLSLMDARFGLDDYYPKHKEELPLTVAYVIDQKGIIQYAFIDDDFRKRADPAELIAVLKRIQQFSKHN